MILIHLNNNHSEEETMDINKNRGEDKLHHHLVGMAVVRIEAIETIEEEGIITDQIEVAHDHTMIENDAAVEGVDGLLLLDIHVKIKKRMENVP